MPYNIAKKAEVAERRAEVVRRKARGATYAAIAADMGVSPETARQDAHIVYRERVNNLREAADEIIAEEYEELEAIRLLMWRVALTKHHHLTREGKPAYDKNGEPILDSGPIMQAGRVLLAIQERKARLLGYDAALKIDVKAEVVTVDAIDAAIRQLRDDIAREEADAA